MYILYHEKTCPYCKKVRDFMKDNGITPELRDWSNEKHSKDLIKRGGKRQVPYLVDTETQTEMYESDDIIEYLQNRLSQA